MKSFRWSDLSVEVASLKEKIDKMDERINNVNAKLSALLDYLKLNSFEVEDTRGMYACLGIKSKIYKIQKQGYCQCCDQKLQPRVKK